MSRIIRYFFVGLIGAIFGYLAFVIAGNIENFPFLTIRSLITGKPVMSEIVYHPADNWIIPALEYLFVMGGAASGLLIAMLFQWKKRP